MMLMMLIGLAGVTGIVQASEQKSQNDAGKDRKDVKQMTAATSTTSTTSAVTSTAVVAQERKWQDAQSAELARFYKQLDEQPKVIQDLVKEYLIGSCGDQMSKHWIHLASLNRAPYRIRQIDWSGPETLDLFLKQLDILGDYATSPSTPGSTREFAMSGHDEPCVPLVVWLQNYFYFDVLEKYLKKFHYELSVARLQKVLARAHGELVIEWDPARVGAELEVVRASAGPIDTPLFKIVGDLLPLLWNTRDKAPDSPEVQDALKALHAVGLDPDDIPSLFACLKTLQHKLRSETKFKTRIELCAKDGHFSVCVKRYTGKAVPGVVWSVLLSDNQLSYYYAPTKMTSSISVHQGEDSSSFYDIGAVRATLMGMPFRHTALCALLCDVLDEYETMIDEIYSMQFIDNEEELYREASRKISEGLSPYAVNLHIKEMVAKLKRTIEQEHLPRLELLAYWQEYFKSLSHEDKQLLSKRYPWLAKYLDQASQEHKDSKETKQS